MNNEPAFPWGEHGSLLGGLTKREYFAIHCDQPGVSELVTAAGLICPDNWSVWRDKDTKLGTFTEWYAKLTNTERFELYAKVRVQTADAMCSALKGAEQPRGCRSADSRVKEALETLQAIALAGEQVGTTQMKLAANSLLTRWSWEDAQSLTRAKKS